MRIVIEGPDGAGKTTLAKCLAVQYGLSHVHSLATPTSVDPFVHYIRRFLDHPNTVFDRLALSEYVYGPLLRHANRFPVNNYETFENLLHECRVQTIVCLPSWKTCLANWQPDEVISDVEVLRDAYNRWAELIVPLEVMIYNYTEDSVNDVLDYVDETRRFQA